MKLNTCKRVFFGYLQKFIDIKFINFKVGLFSLLIHGINQIYVHYWKKINTEKGGSLALNFQFNVADILFIKGLDFLSRSVYCYGKCFLCTLEDAEKYF